MASSVWRALERPFIASSFSLSTQPFISGRLGGSNLAHIGRSMISPLPESFFTCLIASFLWLIGRCPKTSPEITKLALCSSSRQIAVLNIYPWQSIQGLNAFPYPYFGLKSTSRKYLFVIFTLSKLAPASAALRSKVFSIFSSLLNPISKCRA